MKEAKMRAQVSAVLVLCVVGVWSGSFHHANLGLLPPRADCGRQLTTYPPPPADGNGVAAGLAEFPWLALLDYSKSDTFQPRCSGVLIADKYVLTAAHCAGNSAKKRIGDITRVRLGEYDVKTDKDCVQQDGKEECADADAVRNIDVEEVIVHREYNESNVNHPYDIALIRLKTAAPFTNYIRPICLPLEDVQQATSGINMLLAGWDRVNIDKTTNIKQKSSLPLVDTATCLSKYGPLKVQLGWGQMCAGGVENAHSCIALGGSALMAPLTNNGNLYAHGIVSFGPTKCSQNGVPDVFTRVSEYVPWILDNMKP